VFFFFNRQVMILVCLLTIGSGAFANAGTKMTGTTIAGTVITGITISDKLLQEFKQTFPNAVDVKWIESTDKYTVDFKENGITTKIDYDKDGNFVSSFRYYTEKNLPISLLCKIQKKYPGKKVFGVTEITLDNSIEYYIKLEDEKYWLTVKSNIEGSMQVVEKFKKAE